MTASVKEKLKFLSSESQSSESSSEELPVIVLPSIEETILYVTEDEKFLASGILVNPKSAISDYTKLSKYCNNENAVDHLRVGIGHNKFQAICQKSNYQVVDSKKDQTVTKVISNKEFEKKECSLIAIIFVSTYFK